MNNPVAPCILIYDNQWFEPLPELVAHRKESVTGLIKYGNKGHLYLYDSTGNKWACSIHSDTFKNTPIKRFLAKTIYNPYMDARLVWEFESSYTLDELKKQMVEFVNNDDDVITQFEEADIIKSALSNTRNIQDIIEVFNKYVFDPDVESIENEQKKRDQSQ